MQNSNVIHILPQPRTIPKGVIWTIYAIVAICLIAAMITILKTDGKGKSKKRVDVKIQEQTVKPTFEARMTHQDYGMIEPKKTHPTTTTTSDAVHSKFRLPERKEKSESPIKKYKDSECRGVECAKDDTNQNLRPNEAPTSDLVTLQEIVAYESQYLPRFRNLSWFEDSSDEVIDWVSSKEVAITSVMEISTRLSELDNCTDFEDPRPEPDERHVLAEVPKSDAQHVQNETRKAEQGVGEIAGKNGGGTREDFGEETRERPRRHVATLHGCHGEGYGSERMRCRFVVRVLSTMLDDVQMDFAKKLAAQFWSVARDRPGVYGFGHEVPSGPKEIKRHVHRCRYVIRIPLNSSDTTCVIKAQEEYEYLWNSQHGVNHPKYTITTTETCPNHELTWTDEYEFDTAEQANHHLVHQLTTGFFKWPPKSYWRPRRKRKRKIETNKASRCVGAAAEGSDDAATLGTEARRTGDCGGSWRPQLRETRSNRREDEETDERRRSKCATEATKEAKFECQFSDLLGTRTFVEKPLIEYQRIGKTDWVVHTISQWNEELESSILSLAMSNGTELLADLKESHRLDTAYEWIPVAGKDYKPLVANDIYVTHLVAVRLISVEEAIAYYIGAPVANLSRRLLYRTKIVVPPLEYGTLEPAECMTCPGVPMSSTSSNEGGHDVSGVHRRPQCIFSEVVMCKTRQKYILKCWGPDFPWVSVVATCSNLVTSQLEMMAEKRKHLESKAQPVRREFSSFVGGAARLHLPPDLTDENGRCRRRPKLVLVINDAMYDQLVDAEYDLSLTTYLTTVKGYAVLYVDPRANFFDAVDASKMKMHERESEQLTEYLRMVHKAAKSNPCIKPCKGFGLLGKHYGGHLVLNFVADDWRSNDFRCSAAIRPFAPWQRYVYPFHNEPPENTGKSKLERNMARDTTPFKGYMEQLVSQLPGKNLFLYVGNPSDPQLKPYAGILLSLAKRYELSLYHDSSGESDYESKLKLYEALVKYLEDCFRDKT